MKKMTRNSFKSLVFSLLASSFLLFSCTNDIDSASTTAGLDNSGDDSVVLNDNDGTSDKTSRKDLGGSSSVIDFGDDFIRGFDASAVDYWENDYTGASDKSWYDTDGKAKDFFEILRNHGYNTVRLRIWVDPKNATVDSDYWPASKDWRVGDNDLDRTIRMAKRAKAAGLDILLDFHYSDYWTDPGAQVIPKAWQTITSADAMAEKLKEYTIEVLTAMKEADVTPSFVQIGNEINPGILVHTSYTLSSDSAVAADDSVSGKQNGSNIVKYLKAASEGVREASPDAKIIVHVTRTDRIINLSGVNDLYDIIGLSYYAWTEGYYPTETLASNIATLKSTYNKPVLIVETSANYGEYGDDYAADMERAATNLASLTDLETKTESGKTYMVGSEENQKAILRHTMQVVFEAGGLGICSWGGERRDYQYGVFSWEGKPYAALDAFNYKPSDGDTAEDGAESANSGSTSGSSDDDTRGGNDSSSDEKDWQELEEVLVPTVSETLSKIFVGTGEFTALKFEVTNVSGAKNNDNWITFTADTNWQVQKAVETSTQASDETYTWTAEITDSEEAAKYNSGIFVAGKGTPISDGTTIKIYYKGSYTSGMPYTAENLSTTPFKAIVKGTGSNQTFLSADSFSGLSDGTLTASATWISGSGTGDVSYGWGNTWKASTDVSTLGSNPLVIWMPSGNLYTITVTYKASTGGGNSKTGTVEKESITFTASWETVVEGFASGDFSTYSGKTVSKINIQLTDTTTEKVCAYAGSKSDSNWLGNLESTTYSCDVTDSTKISNAITNGIVFAGGTANSTAKVTVTITYTE